HHRTTDPSSNFLEGESGGTDQASFSLAWWRAHIWCCVFGVCMSVGWYVFVCLICGCVWLVVCVLWGWFVVFFCVYVCVCVCVCVCVSVRVCVCVCVCLCVYK